MCDDNCVRFGESHAKCAASQSLCWIQHKSCEMRCVTITASASAQVMRNALRHNYCVLFNTCHLLKHGGFPTDCPFQGRFFLVHRCLFSGACFSAAKIHVKPMITSVKWRNHQFRCLFSRVHATLYPALSVGLSVCLSVVHTLLILWLILDLTAPGQMVKWPQIWPLPTRTQLR